MKSSLFFKLIGTFFLVIVLGAVITSLLTTLAARDQFRVFTTRSGQAWAERLAPSLADYYARRGSWQGVDAFLQTGNGPAGGMGGMMSGGMMNNGHGQGTSAGNMWAMMGQRLVLADADGKVVSDTQGEWLGKQLDQNELAQGLPILVDNRPVGTLVAGSADTVGSQTTAGEFLSAVNRSILIAVLLAGVAALGVGGFLFFQITSPIHRLTRAARTIAAGDLRQRVPVGANDEIGELAASFNQMAESLAEAETQRRQMVADVAHELRNPLSVIQGSLEAMLDGVVPLDPEQVASIHGETLVLNRLVDDLRLLSLAEAGQLDLERRPVSLQDLAAQAVERWQLAGQQNGVAITLQAAEDIPPVSVDPDRIAQVLNNLIGNALRYTPEGGRSGSR